MEDKTPKNEIVVWKADVTPQPPKPATPFTMFKIDGQDLWEGVSFDDNVERILKHNGIPKPPPETSVIYLIDNTDPHPLKGWTFGG